MYTTKLKTSLLLKLFTKCIWLLPQRWAHLTQKLFKVRVYLGRTTKVTVTFGGVGTGPKITETSHRLYMGHLP